MSILNIIKSKLYCAESWLKKPKPFYLRVFWVIISTIVVILFGMFITTIYQPQINNFVDIYIYHKEPIVEMRLNHIYIIANDKFVNMSDFPSGNYQLRFNNFMAMNFSPDDLTVVFLTPIGEAANDDKEFFAIGQPLNYIDYNRTVIENNCLFWLPKTVMKGQQNITISFDSMDSFDSTYSQDTNYLEYSLWLTNSGNKEINNYRADICLKEGLIKKVDPKYSENFIKQSSPNCVEIRVEKFMPGDAMRATFYGAPGVYNADLNTSFNSYDENGKLSNEKFTENIIFFMPNCTLVSHFGTIELLKI